MKEIYQQNNIAKEFNIGETKVKICIDYCVKSSIEIENILNNIAQNALPNLNTSLTVENKNYNL